MKRNYTTTFRYYIVKAIACSTASLMYNYRNLPMHCSFAFAVTLPRHPSVATHAHDDTEVVYVESGAGRSQFAGSDFAFSSRMFMVVPPHLRHDQRNERDTRTLCVGLHDSGIERLCGLWPDPAGQIGDIVRDIIHESAIKQPSYRKICLGLCYQLEGAIERASSPNGATVSRDLVQGALEYIGEREAVVSVEELARRLGISTVYLRRLFARQLGRSPHEVLLDARLGKARHLLRDSSCTIAHIARQCGFETPHYFARMFRKHTGMTPRTFRSTAQ